MRRLLLVTAGLLLCASTLTPRTATAHEMRPSLFELSPRGDGRVDVRFRIGFARGVAMPLTARLPAHCADVVAPVVVETPPVRTLRWVADCGEAGLSGTVAVDGLGRTGTDVIVRAPAGTVVLRPSTPEAELPDARGAASGMDAVAAYVGIGVEHIWLGPDHLLFVLGLMLLVGWRPRQLLATVTAFTVGHSVTLALATLGVVDLPTRAVEAVIALSIVVLAAELVRPGAPSRAARAPWVFAVVCGLLHGFGFAGVLGDVGLPPDAIPAALLGFNVGVEVGQLAFVAVLLVAGAAATRAGLARGRPALVYAMGAIGAFWVWDRATPILTGLGV